MSIDINVSREVDRSALGAARIVEIASGVLRAERVRHALVSITLLDARAMARLNQRHLDHAGPTDVISFGFSRATEADPVVGDIYICPSVAKANAARQSVGVREELGRLVIHGVLHILGYEHPEQVGRERSDMWKRQERLVRRLVAPPV